MRSLQKHTSRRQTSSEAPPSDVDHDRRGSVLLVVIGLMGMLLLLGIAFYSFAGQAQVNSQYYAEASKVDDNGLSPEKLWEFSLEQLIVGPDSTKTNSALWGRRHALLTGLMGRTTLPNFDGFDLTPFNGQGFHLSHTPVGDPIIDMDYDGAADPSQSGLSFNYSPVANGGNQVLPPTSPAPDVDYTVPDINSLALSFVGKGIDVNGADVRVIIPSFHRPQYLRSGGSPITDWQISNQTPQRVLRPHPNHVVGNPGSTTPRFLSALTGVGTNALGETVGFFPFGSTASMPQGVWDMKMATPGVPLTAPISPVYQWDVDNDGDGVKEGIWLDLDYPVQTLADGRMYVPLFSFTVIDADGLINLNVSGNQNGLASTSTPFSLSGGLHVSRSNMGLSRAEISPEWAMYADPTLDPSVNPLYFNSVASLNTAEVQHELFWNAAAFSINRTEMANIETVFLNIGRPDFTDVTSGTYAIPGGGGTTYEPAKYYAGRYDELELMGRNKYTPTQYGMAGRGDGSNRDFSFMPKPGRSAQMFGPIYGDDDNDDSTPGLPSATYWDHVGHSRFDTAGYFFMGASYISMRSGTAIPSFVHPLDFWGDGVGTQASINGMKIATSQSSPYPGVWPSYPLGVATSNSYSTPGADTTGSGFSNYLNAGAGNLLPNAHAAQIDEPDEIVAEWEFAASSTAMAQDEIFGPDNFFELQGTDADLLNSNIQGRIRDLAPFNFKLNSQAEAIRHQFTVLSHDRKNFGLGSMGPNSPFRAWEFNADADADLNLEFPPAFIPNMSGGYSTGNSPVEPFRQVLRQLLYVESNQTISITNLAQLRLNLNRLLVTYDTVSGPVGAPVYRDLTPHPLTLPNAPITAPTWNADAPTGAAPPPNDQEYWARYDRQRMARDIYVLLYTLGGGNDATNYTSDNSGRAIYSNAQLKEMAQFAVNVVDALDRDDVISKFEYDRNLADGWSLDDNPYNGFTDPESSLPDRSVVYGVEAQKLTFSEVMGIISRRVESSPGNYVDHIATQVNDSQGMSDRYYTYMELRNASPFSIDLSNGQWQIAVQDYNDNGADTIPNTGDETDIVQLTLISGSATSVIGPGALFTIGTRGGPAATDPSAPTNNLPSLFKVDATGNPTPDFSAANPNSWVVTAPTLPLSLDLIPTLAASPNNTALFRLTNGNGSGPGGIPGAGADVSTAGNFLFGGAGGNVTAAQEMIANPYYFILRRRAHPTRTMPVSHSSSVANHRDQSLDNPWVEVDRMAFPGWREFALAMSDTATDVQNKLLPLTSLERGQPFSRGVAEATHAPAVGASYRGHTIGDLNSNSPGTFSQVQAHFDRDFASVVDLLSVPLYGPDEVTRRVGHSAAFDNSNSTSFLAQERFLRPQHRDNMAALLPPGPPGVAFDNRWYRLFEFIEVPTQSQTSIRSYPFATRTSGALNLNMIRTRGVIAGLLDDPDNPNTPAADGHFTTNYATENVMLVDQYESGGPAKRDWWAQFLQSRDGFDPLTGLVLPGTTAGRPFRSLGFMEHRYPVAADTPEDITLRMPIEDTIFRSLPIDLNVARSVAIPGKYSQISDRRGLFEARTISDRPSISGPGSETVDPYSKQRLLRKVVNNSTTRSNVFGVWISTRFFEAVQAPSGEIQIGDVLQGTKDHRGFFVVDRSLPEQAFVQRLGKFDFRKFVQYRKTLQ